MGADEVEAGGKRERGWLRRLVPVLVVLVSLGILAGGAYVAWQLLVETTSGPADEDIARASEQVQEAVGPDVIDEVRATISESHDRLNEAFGYGGLDDVDFAESEQEVADPVAERLEDLLAEVDDTSLERDLRTVIRFLEIGVERENIDALAWAHRVLHDLDYFAFNPDEEGNYWEATVTLEGEENEAQRYLAELEDADEPADG